MVAEFYSDLAASSVVEAQGGCFSTVGGRQRSRGHPESAPALEGVVVLPSSAARASTGPSLL